MSIKLVPIKLSENLSENETDVDFDDTDAGSNEPMMGASNEVAPEEPKESDPEEEKSPLTKIADFFDDLIHKTTDPEPKDIDNISVVSDDDLSGYTLHQAASEGSVEFLEQVIKRFQNEEKQLRIEVNHKNTDGFSALHLAARHNKKAIIVRLLELGAHIDMCGGDECFTPLHLATKYDMVSAAKCLLSHGADAVKHNKYGTTALHYIARRGNLELCETLLGYDNVHPGIRDNAAATPLHSAMLGGNIDVVKCLINHGADINAEDKEGERPIHFAAADDQLDLIVLMAKAAISKVPTEEREKVQRDFVNAVTNESDTALHIAAQGGYEETVKTLITIGANVNARTDTKATPLHLAAISGQLSVVRYLVRHGARINCRDDHQETPLHKASQYGRLNIVKFLQENGADLTAKNHENFTPLLCAVWKGQNEIVEYLLSINEEIIYDSDINMKNVFHIAIEENMNDTLDLLMQKGKYELLNGADKDYQTPLHYAAKEGNVDAIDMLLSKSAKVDCSDNEEKTPIHLAADAGMLQAVQLLCEAASGIINSTDDHGQSALHKAAIHGHKRVCHTLIEMGAETSCRDDVAWTPLDYAAQNGHSKTVRLLLDNDAPVDAIDKNQRTPLHHASINGHVDCINILLDYGASISKQDRFSQNCLELAVTNFQRDACMAFIKHKRWKETLSHQYNDGAHPMEKLIECAPEVAEIVMTNCIEHSKEGLKHKDHTVTYNFEYLHIHPDNQRFRTYFAPENMIRHKRETLLSHPLIVKLIDVKFGRLARWIYLINLSIYLLFISLLTALLVIDKERMKDDSLNRTNKTTFQEVVPWLTLFLTIIQIVKELLQLYYLRLHYFKDVVNYLEIILYTSTLLFMAPFLIQSLDAAFNTSGESNLSDGKNDYLNYLEDIKWNAGAIAILTAWSNLLLYFKRFPTFGLYVVMFVEVFKTVVLVLLVFSIFIIAFALSFFVLLSNTNSFKYVGRSFVKTAVMSIGEFEYSSILGANMNIVEKIPYKVVTFLIFILFLIIMPILIMNLLVGLAIGDIEAVRNTAYLRILKAQVRILYTLESTYPKWLLSKVYISEFIHKPNVKKWYKRLVNWFIHSDYDSIKEEQKDSSGKSEKIIQQLTANREELSKQKKRMKSLVELLDEQFETMRRIGEELKIEENS